jgi:hypothetical protein
MDLLKKQIRFRSGVGVIVAVIGVWVLGGVGTSLLVHSLVVADPLFFAPFGVDDAVIQRRVWLFFLLRFTALMPSLTFAAIVITMSELRHPMRAAFWIALGFQLWHLGFQLFRWPWSAIPGLDQSIPILAEGATLVLIVGCTVLFTWLLLIYDKWKARSISPPVDCRPSQPGGPGKH